MFSSSSCNLINTSDFDHENQTLVLQQQECHAPPFLVFHHDPFFLPHENDFLAAHDDHQDPHQFLAQKHQLQLEEILLLGSCNDNNGGQEPAAAAAVARSSSSSRGARSLSSNSNSNKKKRSISDHGDGAKQPSQRRRSGKKDRHSKIYTAQGPRDRRMRLSLQIARKFFYLQDILGFDKASKTIEWLFTKSKSAIKELTDSNGGKSIPATVLSCTSESEVASSSAIINVPEQIKITGKVKKRLSKLPVFNPVGRDRARARARERTKEKMRNNMVKGCSSPPNPSGSNLEQEIMPTTGGEELQEGECLLQKEMDSFNLADHLHSKQKLGDAALGSTTDSSSFLDLISQQKQQQQQQQQQQHGFEGKEEEDFSWYPVNNTILPEAGAGMQYPFPSFMNVSPIFSQQQRTSSLNLATASSSCFDHTQESVTLNFSNHHQITNTASGILPPHLLENYHLSCNPSCYKFDSLF